jgi:hypothetical protein
MCGFRCISEKRATLISGDNQLLSELIGLPSCAISTECYDFPISVNFKLLFSVAAPVKFVVTGSTIVKAMNM